MAKKIKLEDFTTKQRVTLGAILGSLIATGIALVILLGIAAAGKFLLGYLF